MKPAIAFITPPFFWASLPLPGLGYLMDRAQNLGFETRLFDLNLRYYKILGAMKKDWTVNRDYIQPGSMEALHNQAPFVLEELYSELSQGHYAYFAISLFKGNFHFADPLSKELKTRFPQVKILWGGPQLFTLYSQHKDFGSFSYVDHFVVGEGEKALEKVLSEEGERIHLFEQEKDLQDFPRYQGIDLKAYPRKGCLPIVGSRGCVNHCRFCAEKHLFKGYRFRQAEDILSEMEFHRTNNNIGHFIFYDSLFNGHLKNLEAMCQGIIRRNLKCTWEAQIAVNNRMNGDLMELMKAAGCVNLFIGLESGSDAVLQKMNKAFSVNEASLFLRQLSQAALQFEISIISAFPGEEIHHHQETLDFLRHHKKFIAKIAQVSSYQEYPGTESGPAQEEAVAVQRLKEIRTLLINEKIPFTPSYIDNLV
ncbi:MAG: radical SAM protein [Spirochaetales bacterium]|nr:radical SAM protein [Spirochaetales bacterium]